MCSFTPAAILPKEKLRSIFFFPLFTLEYVDTSVLYIDSSSRHITSVDQIFKEEIDKVTQASVFFIWLESL